MLKSGAINAAQYPFTARAIEIDYVSPPKQKVVFLDTVGDASVSVSICNPCGTLYPHDPRNLSIGVTTGYMETIDGELIYTISGELLELL